MTDSMRRLDVLCLKLTALHRELEEHVHSGPCTFECDEYCSKKKNIREMVELDMSLGIYLNKLPGIEMLIKQLERTNLSKSEELWKLKKEIRSL